MYTLKINERSVVIMLQPKIGEIYYMKFSGNDSEQHGWRPGIIVQNDVGNAHSPNVIAIPLTTCLKKLNMPTHVFISSEFGLPRDSVALCENPQRMSKHNLGHRITSLSTEVMSKIAIAYTLATSVIAFIDQTTLIETWEKSKKLVYTV
jgi:mRNA interferase MazF